MNFILSKFYQTQLHINLLGVQHRPVDRLSMCSVVLMLGGKSAFPSPNHQVISMETDHLTEPYSSSSKHVSSSTITMTVMEAP